MLPSIADAAPAVLGVLLVFGGFLSNLALAAGIPSATELAGLKLNHSSNRHTYDDLHRRPHADERHPANSSQVADAVINRRHRGDTLPPSPSESRPDCRYDGCSGGARPAQAPAVAVLETGRANPGVVVGDLVSLGTRMRPATKALQVAVVTGRKKTKKDDDDDYDDDYDDDDKSGKQGGPAKTFKIKKHKLKKWLLPLLVGYKLKFMTLVPLLFATLALLVASAGFAGFFFAMFTAALTLPKGGHH